TAMKGYGARPASNRLPSAPGLARLNRPTPTGLLRLRAADCAYQAGPRRPHPTVGLPPELTTTSPNSPTLVRPTRFDPTRLDLDGFRRPRALRRFRDFAGTGGPLGQPAGLVGADRHHIDTMLSIRFRTRLGVHCIIPLKIN